MTHPNELSGCPTTHRVSHDQGNDLKDQGIFMGQNLRYLNPLSH